MQWSMAEVAAKIRGRMRELGYTQRDIGFFLRLAQGSVSKKMTGITPFEVDEIVQLSYFLELPELRELIDVAGEYYNRGEYETKVAERERELALHTLQHAIGVLPPKERRIFLLAAALVLSGILPPEAKKDSQVLRSISKIDLSSSLSC